MLSCSPTAPTSCWRMCHTHTYHIALHLFWRFLFASQTWKLLLKFPAWLESLWCTAAMIVPNAQTPRVTSGTGCFSLLIRLTETRRQTLEQGIFWSFASDLHIWHLQEGVSQSVMANCQHAERENANISFPTETQQKERVQTWPHPLGKLYQAVGIDHKIHTKEGDFFLFTSIFQK